MTYFKQFIKLVCLKGVLLSCQTSMCKAAERHLFHHDRVTFIYVNTSCLIQSSYSTNIKLISIRIPALRLNVTLKQFRLT